MKEKEEIWTERSGIYTSRFNDLVDRSSVPERVEVLDTTLRDGEQTPGIALSVEDKVRIAELLDDLGVDVIEAGFAITSPGEREAVKRIGALGLRSRVCSLARCRREDVDAVIDCDLNYAHLFLATSEIHMKHKLKMTQAEVKSKAIESIEYAKSHGLTVEFSCEDATRTEIDFLKEMHVAVQEAGADKINMPDTVGTMSPPAMEYLVQQVMPVMKVPLSLHCHNDFGLAVANTLAGVRYGARQVHVCVNGLGERAGNASLEEVVMGLSAFLGVRTNIEMRKIGHASKTVARMTGFTLADNKPIVGKNAFAHESGIHVHGVLRDPSTYEAFSPELVGMQREIVVGKHTGAHSVKRKLYQYGVEVTDDQLAKIVDDVKRLAESGKHVDDAELVALAAHFAGQDMAEERRIKLREFAVFTGVNITPTAVVAVEIDGDVRRGSMIGIGPVDAAVNAIKSVLKDRVSLEEYRLSAITGGSDALCEVSVKMRLDDDGQVMSVGKSVGSDIVNTSVDATIEAIDRLYLRKRNLGKENIGK
ncbi:MAG: 2-isopropylmalate synthase [Methanomassiliicoccales archaeon]|jgi:2-isopropylmalate synthase